LFVLDGTQLYLARYFVAECRLAAAIRARLAEPPRASFEAVIPLFRQLFPRAAQAMDWQALAATAALRSSLTFITGGPGTGKTTVAAKLLALLLQGDATLRIAVAAPTGRAAARLAEAIGAAAAREQLGPLVTQHLPATGSTLHRLLGYQPWADRFTHHAAHPLAAVKPSARLIVLGDPDQLASVDTGFVLGDIARAARSHGNEVGHSASLGAAYATLSGADPSLLPVSPQATALHNAVIRLRTSYRFGAQPGIGALAMATQAGNAAAAVQVLHDGALSDVAMHAPARSLVEQLGPVLPQLEHYLASSTPAEALGALAQFRVLCALRDGEAGVTGLNQRIERWLQQRGRTVAGWYDHRPVLITANDPATQLFNGDVGTTLAVDGVPLVHFPLSGGGYRSLAPSRLPAHETAWAMTVHKSQGSEFDHVLLVLPDTDSRILTRELVYTGLTRARRAVTISGTDELLRLAISRSVARVSGLTARLA
jgi:exodeoxyribonuclease V alpha subunit